MEINKSENNLIRVSFFAFILLPFLSIAGIKNAVGGTLYGIWQIISLFSLLVFVLIKINEFKINWVTVLFMLYEGIILLSSIINKVVTPGIIVSILFIVFIFLILQTKFYRELIHALSFLIVISAIINLPFMFIYESSFEVTYFIGGKNAIGIFLIPGGLLLLVNSFENYNKVNKYTLIAFLICVLSVFIGASGTGIIVALSTIILLIFSMKVLPEKSLYLGIILFVYLLFLVISKTFFSSNVWGIITGLLGKDSTLTSRTAIWDSLKNMLSVNYLLGVGRGAEINCLSSWGEYQVFSEAHNFILEIVMQGGFLGLIIFGVLFFKANSELNMRNKAHKIIFIAICVLLINGLTESVVNSIFFIFVFALACRYSKESQDEKLNITIN